MDVGSALTSSVIHFHGNDKAHGWRYQMSYTTSYYHIIFHTLHNKPAIVEEHEKELYRSFVDYAGIKEYFSTGLEGCQIICTSWSTCHRRFPWRIS